ncbi:MAG TPA: ABC transporter substrate-binding protein, partial [Bacillota bacterium]
MIGRSPRALLLAGVLAVVAWAAAACTQALWQRDGGAADEPRGAGVYGGRWVEALAALPRSFDPARAVTRVDGRVLTLLFDGLVRLTPEGRLEPALAEGWSISADGHVYTFKLRPGVRFHDGAPLTADDVVFSLRRLLDPQVASPRRWVLSALEGADAFAAGVVDELTGIEAVDPRTVRLTLARPGAPLLMLLATPAAFIVPQHDAPRDSGWRPVGTGPFRLAGSGPDGSLKLTAFDAYYAGRPYLDEVHLRLLPDAEARLEAFLDGELTVLKLTAGQAQHLREELGWGGPLQRSDPPAVYYLALNNQKPPLTDPLVRRAIYHAIDRRSLLDEILGPDGYMLANGSIPPGLPGHDAQAAGLPYDPGEARRLLVRAGWAQGFELDLVASTSELSQALARGIVEMLAEVGIRGTVRTLSDADFYAATGRDGQAGAFMLSWWGDYPDAENFLYPLFHSQLWGAGGNRAKFGSPEIDRLLEELHRASDDVERPALYRRVEAAVFEQVPWVPLFFP